ncbi:xanthine dehydrogenase small subunit [uncultured Sphingomonas sp.]|uniref:xanthine dehydrogenase small subunit n=1 Tax=uncultured Sphingomonas sp. TaxID=158754 RepID=UPI0035CB9AE5
MRFVLDDEIVTVTVADADPNGTLLDHLRERLRRTGTKEGCAEGDCGSCTVLVGELDGDGIAWRAVNACILLLPMLRGKALLTVESLSRGGTLTALQAYMAGNGSSQCGFCTPGFVMSLYARCIGAAGSALPVEDVIAGNLCRCTGYGPILAAADAVGTFRRDDRPTVAALRAIAADDASGVHGGRRWFAPADVATLVDLLVAHPNARIVAGATDVGLWVTKELREIETLIFVGDMVELRQIEETPASLTLGAAVRYAEAHAALARLHPDLGELVRRIGGLQVRNAGTIGGNIANGSPIGDMSPALIALDATLTLRGPAGARTMPLEEYFLGYGRQDRRAGEFVERLHVPRPTVDDVIHISKLSRRFDGDISAVCGAVRLRVEDGRIAAPRVAFGGMAATPRRAHACEATLDGQPFALTTIDQAARTLRDDFTPLSDVRGSAAYRLTVAANLLRRLWHRSQGEAVSVLETVDG